MSKPTTKFIYETYRELYIKDLNNVEFMATIEGYDVKNLQLIAWRIDELSVPTKTSFSLDDIHCNLDLITFITRKNYKKQRI